MSDLNQPTRYFRGLQQGAFMRLEHAASLKGLLKPFKGKGDFETWASQCFAMRDELIDMAQRQVLQQAVGHPFHCPWSWPSRPRAQARRFCAGASTTAQPWA